MDLESILFSQGFGSRRQCRTIVAQGRVRIAGSVCTDADAEFASAPAPEFEVDGTAWRYREKAYIALNKPAGYECSRDPQHHLSVFHLLPAQLCARGVQSVGRLDQDTTGLLLLTDDGQFIHRMGSPKHHVPKVYEVTTKHPVAQAQLDKLLAGVVLDDDPKPVRAAAAEAVTPHHMRLTLTQGKYHQVKRMVAAAGNRVEALHRSRIGDLALPDELAAGQWRWLTAAEVEALRRA